MSSTTPSPRSTPSMPTAEAVALEALLLRLERCSEQLDRAVALTVRRRLP